MARVLYLRGGSSLHLVFAMLALSDRPSICCLDGSLFDLKPIFRLEDVEIQREKFERSKSYFSRAQPFVSQQPKYNRQFGNGGLSGRVPYKLKRERHLYRSKYD